MIVSYQKIDCRLGTLHVYAQDKYLVGIFFNQNLKESLKLWLSQAEITNKDHPVIRKFEKQLLQFLDGKRKNFDLPLKMAGSAFQQKAWKALMAIPYGQTSSYAKQAHKIGFPKAVRAVGTANGRNPFPIIVPCHRILRSDGSLGGYAGGLKFKSELLKLESSP